MTKASAEPFAFCLRGMDVRELADAVQVASAAQLPETLVIPPGAYRVHGKTYRLEQEGLYRFFHPMRDNQQRIVYRKDLYALMSAVGWIHSHGSRDDYKGFDEVMRLGLTGKLILTCGPYSNFVVQLFSQLGIRIRRVSVRTLLERNGYNDGHVLSEVCLDGRWLAFDADPHVMYRHCGKRLSLLDLIPHVQAGDYEREPLAQAAKFAVTDFKDAQTGYDFGLYYEVLLAQGDAAFRRVMMIPFVTDAGKSHYTAYNEADRRRAGQSWPKEQYLPPEEFRSRFYPESG